MSREFPCQALQGADSISCRNPSSSAGTAAGAIVGAAPVVGQIAAPVVDAVVLFFKWVWDAYEQT